MEGMEGDWEIFGRVGILRIWGWLGPSAGLRFGEGIMDRGLMSLLTENEI